jgi:hypothetical protein
MPKPSPATIAAHDAAINALASTTSTTDFAAALDTWQRLDAPGFADDLPDGNYFDGYFFATKRGAELAVTQIRQLPFGTLELWQQLEDGQRAAGDREHVLAEMDAEQRGPGRPAVGKPFPVRLPDWRRRMITADAAYVGVKDAELVRWLIGHAYAALDRDAREAGTTRIELIRTRLAERAPRSTP